MQTEETNEASGFCVVIFFLVLSLAILSIPFVIARFVEGKWLWQSDVDHPSKQIIWGNSTLDYTRNNIQLGSSGPYPLTEADVNRLIDERPGVKACDKVGGVFHEGTSYFSKGGMWDMGEITIAEPSQIDLIEHDNCTITSTKTVLIKDLMK